jgi:hypothetical protein
MNEYTLAVANKLAAEHGLAECDKILEKFTRVNSIATTEEVMAELEKGRVEIRKHQETLRRLLHESNDIIMRYNAPLN